MAVALTFRRSTLRTLGCLCILFWLASYSCAAQPLRQSGVPAVFDLDRDRKPLISLDGLWRFHPGDDPNWADSGYDDSAWPLLRSDKPWADQGYKAMSGYGWYRFAVQLPIQSSSPSEPLALLLPPILTSYEVYLDGQRAGSVGNMPPHTTPHASFEFHQFPFPASSSPTPRTLHVAIRVWHSPIWASYIGGGPSRGDSLLGNAELIQTELIHRRVSREVIFVDNYVYAIAGLLVGLTIIGLFFFRPKEHEYLWCAVLVLSLAIDAGFQIGYNIYGFLPVPVFDLLDGALIAANLVAALCFFSIVLKARRGPFWRVTLALAIISPLDVILYWPGWLSVPASAALQLICLLPSSFWLLVVLVRAAYQRDLDARLLLVPTGLYIGFGFVFNLAILLSQAGWILMPDVLLNPLPLPPFTMHWIIVFDLIFLASMLAFLIRRFTQARQGEERFASQLEAARQVQQVLLPEEIAQVPGFDVECVYEPADVVGGDFFQILRATDGGLMVVVGDVAGKGLPAALMVSILVGAIRGEAAHTSDPGALLASLNEQMFGQSHGKFTTCLCLHLTAAGEVTAACAGHLAPYCDGIELHSEPALPLGIIRNAHYRASVFTLALGQRLTIVSDGVLEAQSREGELLGFDRTRAMSTLPAAEIAARAKAFGQNDDITVVTIAYQGTATELPELASQAQVL
jgi:stage II sporulation SpoE-like protein